MCSLCSKEMTSRSNVLNHLKAVHVCVKNHGCRYCSLIFANNKQLLNHIGRKHKADHKVDQILKASAVKKDC